MDTAHTLRFAPTPRLQPTGTKLLTRDKSLSSTFLCVAKSIATISEHLVKVVLEPFDIWAKTGKLPHSVNLLVPMGVGAVSVTLDSDRLHAGVGVLLMRYAELVVAHNLVVGDLLPPGPADEVLCLEEWVAQHGVVGDHLEVFIGWHGLPDLVEEGTVVDLINRLAYVAG
jgi:hypothetical protein